MEPDSNLSHTPNSDSDLGHTPMNSFFAFYFPQTWNSALPVAVPNSKLFLSSYSSSFSPSFRKSSVLVSPLKLTPMSVSYGPQDPHNTSRSYSQASTCDLCRNIIPIVAQELPYSWTYDIYYHNQSNKLDSDRKWTIPQSQNFNLRQQHLIKDPQNLKELPLNQNTGQRNQLDNSSPIILPQKFNIGQYQVIEPQIFNIGKHQVVEPQNYNIEQHRSVKPQNLNQFPPPMSINQNSSTHFQVQNLSIKLNPDSHNHYNIGLLNPADNYSGIGVHTAFIDLLSLPYQNDNATQASYSDPMQLIETCLSPHSSPLQIDLISVIESISKIALNTEANKTQVSRWVLPLPKSFALQYTSLELYASILGIQIVYLDHCQYLYPAEYVREFTKLVAALAKDIQANTPQNYHPKQLQDQRRLGGQKIAVVSNNIIFYQMVDFENSQPLRGFHLWNYNNDLKLVDRALFDKIFTPSLHPRLVPDVIALGLYAQIKGIKIATACQIVQKFNGLDALFLQRNSTFKIGKRAQLIFQHEDIVKHWQSVLSISHLMHSNHILDSTALQRIIYSSQPFIEKHIDVYNALNFLTTRHLASSNIIYAYQKYVHTKLVHHSPIYYQGNFIDTEQYAGLIQNLQIQSGLNQNLSSSTTVPERQQIFVIDCQSILNRAYYALSDTFMKSSALNFSTHGVFGFTLTLLMVLENYAMSSPVVIVFDGAVTHKSDAQPDPSSDIDTATTNTLQASIPWVKKICKALGLYSIEVPQVSSHNLIATLASQTKARSLPTTIVSLDKNYMQLLDGESIQILRPSSKDKDWEFITQQSFTDAHEGLHPSSYVDLMAIVGAKQKGITGIKGFGMKSAVKLLSKFGSLEDLLHSTHLITSTKTRDAVLQTGHISLQNKALFEMHCDVSIDDHLDWSDVLRKTVNISELKSLFQKLNFNQKFINRINSLHHSEFVDVQKDTNSITPEPQSAFISVNPPAPPVLTPPISTNHNLSSTDASYFSHIEVISNQKVIMKHLKSAQHISVSMVSVDDTIHAALSYRPGSCVLLDLNTPKGLKIFKKVMESPITKCGWDLQNFCRDFGKKFGFVPQGNMFDINVAHYLISGISATSENIIHSFFDISSLDFDFAKPQTIAEAQASTEFSFRLAFLLIEKMKTQGVYELAKTVEFPLVAILARMALDGVLFDQQELSQISSDIVRHITVIEQQVCEIANQNINLSSPQQVGNLFSGKLSVQVKKKTKTGKICTNEKTLRAIQSGKFKATLNAQMIASLILEYRSLSKFQNTYVKGIRRAINPVTNRVHAIYHQIGAATGRITVSRPNLQAVPTRTEFGHRFRGAVVPAKGFILMAADYNQIELRILAALSGDEALKHAFENSVDVHSLTAAKLFQVDVDKVSAEERSIAKTVNFGIPYGISAYGLAQNLDISEQEATQLINDYYDAFPKVKILVETLINNARETKYAETLLKRRRYMPEIASDNYLERSSAERVAVNMPIQGTQADMIKIAMIRIDKKLKQMKAKSRMILQVHDELIFEVFKGEEEAIRRMVKYEMENALPLPGVALKVSISLGTSWMHASE